MTRFLTLCLLARTLAAQCPNLTPFTPPEKITATDRAYRFEGGYVAVIGEMRVDSDGSPVAYHPLNSGTTHLCNGLDPVIDGKRVRDKKRGSPCFAAVERRPYRPSGILPAVLSSSSTASSPPPPVLGGAVRRQANSRGARATRARFFISTTARQVPGAAALPESQRYLNADAIPYVVVPTSLGPPARCGAAVWPGWNTAKGHCAGRHG
jgi:hypothetical protein